MTTVLKAYKIEEEVDNKFHRYCLDNNITMSKKIEELMQKEMKEDKEIVGTHSFFQDRMSDYIYKTYDMKKAIDEGKIDIDIPKEEASFFKGTLLDWKARMRGAVNAAARLYIQKDVKGLDKQGIVKDLINKRTEVPKIDINITVSGIPIKPLSDFTIADVGEVVQFNAIVIGFEARKTKKNLDDEHEFIEMITLQEPEEESKNNNPVIIPCLLHREDTSNIASGQRKKILGIYKAIPSKNKEENTLIIDCLMLQELEQFREIELNPEQIEKAKQMCKQDEEDYWNKLLNSIAPHIDNRDLEKTALLLSIVGGSKLGNYRKESHLMMIGEPDTGKSELIKYAHKITQKSSIVDGSNATAKGLLYGLDEYDGHKVLRAGVMVLNNNGHVYIDEYDKMGKPEQKAMNISMEQQIAKYDKVGHNVRGETKTTVIAAANPVNDRWNDMKNIIDNCPFDASTLSRFDIIIRLRHSHQQETIKHQIEHILKHMKEEPKQVLDIDFMKGLVNYWREQNPKLSPEAEKRITEFYTYFKGLEQKEGSLVMETRQIIGIIRLCSAYARITFRDMIDEHVVNKIIAFYKATLATLGMNTGSIAQVDLRGHNVNRDEYFEQVWLNIVNDENKVTESWLVQKLMENKKHFATEQKARDYIEARKKACWCFEKETGVLMKT